MDEVLDQTGELETAVNPPADDSPANDETNASAENAGDDGADAGAEPAADDVEQVEEEPAAPVELAAHPAYHPDTLVTP